MSEQDEIQQDCRCLEELLAAVKKRGAYAENVSGSDAQHDEYCHIRDTAAKRPIGGNEEGPDWIENRAAGQDEENEIKPQTEWWRDANEIHPHRGENKDRQAKGERDPEAIADVANHGRQVHARAMAHLLRHGLALHFAMWWASRCCFVVAGGRTVCDCLARFSTIRGLHRMAGVHPGVRGRCIIG